MFLEEAQPYAINPIVTFFPKVMPQADIGHDYPSLRRVWTTHQA